MHQVDLRRRIAVAALALVAGCGPTAWSVRLPADASRTGLDGLDGPLEVAGTTVRVQARVTDDLQIDLLVPREDGVALADAPTVILVQGGLVAPERYAWLGVHLASRGFAVALPHHASDLAIFESANAGIAWDALAEGAGGPAFGEPRAVAGHSLGGVVAAMAFADGGWDALGLFASFPAAGTDAEGSGGPVLALIGSDDGATALEDARAGAARFPDPAWFGVVDGMNHYGWTDDPSERDLAGDGVASRPVPDARRDAQAVIDAFLDAALRGDPDAEARLESAFPGVSR